MIGRTWFIGCVVAIVWPVALVAQPQAQSIELSPTVSGLLDDPVTAPDQRRELALFHGQWDQLTNPLLNEQAAIAWYRYDLTNRVFSDDSSPVLYRAQAALARGEPGLVVQILEDNPTAQAAIVIAQAWQYLGQPGQAVDALVPWRDRLQDEPITDPVQLTAAAQALIMLAQLEGRPANDYQLAMSLLGKVRTEMDPLYWPAYLAEARLLIDKDNLPQAAKALVQALELNPQCGPAWQMLGQLHLNRFDFDKANQCISRLRQTNEQHLLADQLEAQVLLTQKDPVGAQVVLESALDRHPRNRDLLALQAAAMALTGDEMGLGETLDNLQRLSPNTPIAYYTAGRYLSLARQYEAGDKMLAIAIARAPNWPKPRIERGLLLMQWGKESQALTELEHAVHLDPFNRQANNQLKLSQELQGYEQIKTEHFVIKYQQGIDEVLARDMPQELERIYRDVTEAFGYKPRQATLIEVLPNEEYLGVRVTGMPDIWTIAASTGDVIALTPPRTGVKQRGAFDWPRVIRHEFVHTVTLNQTDYHIPHWFTEACAVSQEPGQRAYAQCRLLAQALSEDLLFDLDEITWAFIRPKTPRDRPLAYAQAHWMLQYITVTFGHRAVLELLELFRDATPDAQAIEQVTGQTVDPFMNGFKSWAATQVSSWGLQAHRDEEKILSLLEESTGEAKAGPTLDGLLAQYPQHPEVLKAVAQYAVQHDDATQALQAVLRYGAARPVDPWSDRQVVQLALQIGHYDQAIAALEHLDSQAQDTGDWAYQLAKIHRAAGRLDRAYLAAQRSLHREPYNPTHRELAATLALQLNDLEQTLGHLKAMAILEPDQAIHHTRLAALYTKMGLTDQADAQAQKALQLAPRTPQSPASGLLDQPPATN